jgi:enabled protein
MCKYTIYNLECGHPGEDHVSGKDCPYFKETGVPCDRENPANRNRVNIKSEDRNGICNKCRRKQRELEELEAMGRDEERARQQSLAESKEREAAAKAHEERLLKETREEYERKRRKQEQDDLEFMLQKSREQAEVARLQKEQEDLAKALKASCVLDPSDRSVTVEVKVSARTLGRPVL